MTLELDYGDLPISTPEQDLFGIMPFVQALGRSVRQMKTPQGVVIGLNGPWGSGKSSAMNLLRLSLADAVAAGELAVVSFNPWWFRGEEALVLAFFRELNAALDPSLTAKAKQLLPKLGARLLKAGSVVAPAADALGAGGAGAIASGTMQWLSSLISDGDSVEKLHRELADALAEQTKRFVILIDDIDRLAPDEALAMFRLVKSVGRLPNVIYVLAFDRRLAEKVVQERFPSEGPHYLEKIVQASFELPSAAPADLQRHLQVQLFGLTGEPSEELGVHVLNLFHEVLAPEIRTPRDAARFINAFSVTWPAVAGEVDAGDFIALEALRLFRPTIYQAVRENRQLVCGYASMSAGRSAITHEQLDGILLPGISDTERFRRGLMRLFPKLQSLWSNVYHSPDGSAQRLRRACATEHFSTYFQLSVPDNIISRADVETFIAHAGDSEWIAEKMREAVQTATRGGRTRAAPLLDALALYADDIPLESAQAFLAGIFAAADELDAEADRAKGFSFVDNNLRIHWLWQALLLERTVLGARTKIIMAAAKSAPLAFVADLAFVARRSYAPPAGSEPEDPAQAMVSEAASRRLSSAALKAIESAAKGGSLIEHRELSTLLYRWRDYANDDGKRVRRWTSARLKDDTDVIRLASAFMSYSWGQGMSFSGLGDLVSKRSDRAQVDSLSSIMDQKRFKARLEGLSKKLPDGGEQAEIVKRFLKAWKAQERRRH